MNHLTAAWIKLAEKERTLYRAMDSKWWPSVKKHGLDPSLGNYDGIYLTSDLKGIEQYGNMILAVTVPVSWVENGLFYQDYYVPRVIPPERVERLRKAP